MGHPVSVFVVKWIVANTNTYDFVEPLKLVGDGTYSLHDLKQIKVTDDYLQLNERVKNCQTKESFEDCTTRYYLNRVQDECSCVPYRLRIFSKKDQAKYFL